MSSPELSLENLELVGVSQETASETEESGSVTQILTFNFTAQSAGSAKIKHLSLKWIQGDGAATSELVIPPLELKIAHARKTWLVTSAVAGSTLVFGGLVFLVRALKTKKKRTQPNQIEKSVEDLILDQLLSAENQWKANAGHQEFLSDLTRLFGKYVSQKLGWNPSQDDYNALQKKAEQKWSKKESVELAELFRALEYERFSGAQMETNQLEKLYRNISTFIERKKII